MEQMMNKILTIYTNKSKESTSQLCLIINFLESHKIHFQTIYTDDKNEQNFKTLGKFLSIIPEHRKKAGAKIIFPHLVLLPTNKEKPSSHDVVSAESKKKCQCGQKATYLGSFIEFKNSVVGGEIFEFLKLKKICSLYEGLKIDEKISGEYLEEYVALQREVQKQQLVGLGGTKRKSPTR